MNNSWDVSVAYALRSIAYDIHKLQIWNYRFCLQCLNIFYETFQEKLSWTFSNDMDAMDKNRYTHHETQHSKSVYISCAWYIFDKTVFNCMKYSKKLIGDHSQICGSFRSVHCFYSNNTKRIIVIYAPKYINSLRVFLRGLGISL